MLYYLINFIGNIFEWYIATSFLSSLHKERFSKKTVLLLGMSFTLLQFLSNSVFLTKSSMVVMFSFLYDFLLALLYKSKWYWKVLESLFIFAVNALSEMGFAMFLMLILKTDLSYTQTNLALFFVCTLSTKLISLFIVKALHIGRIRKSISASGIVVLPMLFLPVATVAVTAIIAKAGYSIHDRSFIVLVLISMFLLMAANLVTFWVIEHQDEFIQTKEALRYAEAHIQNQINHYKDLYHYQTEIRRSRHDAQNKMLALSGLLQSGDIEVAKELVSAELEASETASKNVIHSGNPVIDAVLQAKHKTAESKNIALVPIIRIQEKIQINELELGVLIGNAVDNAIEAAEKLVSDTRPEIAIQIRSLMGRIWVCVENPTVEESGSVTTLPSSKHDARNHGYGLKSIQSIADKYDGTVSITWKDHRFTIEIGLSNSPNNVFAS